jgi:hypothetical protein
MTVVAEKPVAQSLWSQGPLGAHGAFQLALGVRLAGRFPIQVERREAPGMRNNSLLSFTVQGFGG